MRRARRPWNETAYTPLASGATRLVAQAVRPGGPGCPLANTLAEVARRTVRQVGRFFRERTFTLLWVFLSPVTAADGSCRQAVVRLKALFCLATGDGARHAVGACGAEGTRVYGGHRPSAGGGPT